MKKKLLCIVLVILLITCILPATVSAYTDGFGVIYDENEYQQLKAFLNLDSASEFGYSNGSSMSYMYNENEPNGWYGVTWAPYTEGSDTVYHVTSINWNTSGSFYSLNGDLDLSNFDHLQSFETNYNHIDSLNVANDTELTSLQCSSTHLEEYDGTVINTGITSLDLSTNIALKDLNCSENALTALDVSNNTALESLTCNNNGLTSLDLTNNSVLEGVNCNDNKITSLDTSAAGTKFGYLHCSGNQISTLNITGNTNLVTLECYNNQIAGALDLTDHDKLVTLRCYGNQFTSLTTAGCSSLQVLECYDNAISSLGLSDNTALKTLDCHGNNLSTLTVSSNTELTTLNCDENQITSLSVSPNTKLTMLYCSDNNLDAIDVSYNTALTELQCSGNAISAIDISKNTLLEEFYCGENLLTELDVSNNTALTVLSCGDNALVELDVTHNALLEKLICNGIGLTALDLTKNVALWGLDCSNNQLETLDLTKNMKLFSLDCSGNLFETLDMSSYFLASLDCTNNPLTYVKAGIPYDSENTSEVELTSSGEGYVGLYFSWMTNEMYAQATPKTGSAFTNWTDATSSVVSTSSKYALEPETVYDLTANFGGAPIGSSHENHRPSVNAGSVSDITFSSATLTGSVISGGGATIRERGFVYSSEPDPLLNGAGVTSVKADGRTGSFTVTLTDLTPGTTYYARAYAVNSKGVAYGKTLQFETVAIVDAASVPKTGDCSMLAYAWILCISAVAGASLLKISRRRLQK